MGVCSDSTKDNIIRSSNSNHIINEFINIWRKRVPSFQQPEREKILNQRDKDMNSPGTWTVNDYNKKKPTKILDPFVPEEEKLLDQHKKVISNVKEAAWAVSDYMKISSMKEPTKILDPVVMSTIKSKKLCSPMHQPTKEKQKYCVPVITIPPPAEDLPKPSF